MSSAASSKHQAAAAAQIQKHWRLTRILRRAETEAGAQPNGMLQERLGTGTRAKAEVTQQQAIWQLEAPQRPSKIESRGQLGVRRQSQGRL